MNSLIWAASPLTTSCIVYIENRVTFLFFNFYVSKITKTVHANLKSKGTLDPSTPLGVGLKNPLLKGLKNLEKLLELYLCDLEPLKAVPIPNCYCTNVL